MVINLLILMLWYILYGSLEIIPRAVPVQLHHQFFHRGDRIFLEGVMVPDNSVRIQNVDRRQGENTPLRGDRSSSASLIPP